MSLLLSVIVFIMSVVSLSTGIMFGVALGIIVANEYMKKSEDKNESRDN